VKKAVLREAENHFSPEFLNRIDDILVFSPLTQEEVQEITRRYLIGIQKHLEAQGKSLNFSEAALKNLAEVGFSLKYGARFLKRRVDEQVKIPVTLHWNEGSHFTLELVEGELRVTWKA
jgi:ATP-dependent Clp protease ATP-binding subunit ClpA